MSGGGAASGGATVIYSLAYLFLPKGPFFSMQRSWLLVIFAAAMALPGLYVRFTHPDWPVGVETALFGLAILAVAHVLTWTAEAAEKDISQGFAVVILALIAVLPEYAVDLYFAWTAPGNPEHAAYAIANMTGANRLLIGFGWALVVGLFWYRTRRPRLQLARGRFKELVFLSIATIWSFSIPLRGELSLLDTVVLVSLFLVYVARAGGGHDEEMELVEPAKTIAALPKRKRRTMLIVLFLYSAAMILMAAEPFAEGLVESGTTLGIDEFLLVQWLAPLASEAPEIIIASILALRGRANIAMAALISSKVNQWTLLVGTLPAAYAISGGFLDPLPLDSRQVEEVFLTSAQSLFAIVLIANLKMSTREAALLFVLFATQLFFTDPTARYIYGVMYLVLAFVMFFLQRREIVAVVRTRGGSAEGAEADVTQRG